MSTDAGVAAAPLQRQPHPLHRPWLFGMEWTEQIQRGLSSDGVDADFDQPYPSSEEIRR